MATSWTQNSKNTSSWTPYIKRGNEPQVGARAESREDIGELTFDSVIDDAGRTLDDVTLEGGDLGDQTYTYPTKN